MAGRPSASARRGGELVRVDASELAALVKRLRAVEDKKVKAALRRALKDSAKPMVDDIKKKVLEPPPSGRTGGRGRIKTARTVTRTHKGVDFNGDVITERTREQVEGRATLRESIAKGVSASLTVRGDSATLTVKAAPRNLGSRTPMVKAYNSRRFRHPVFKTGRWVEQAGNPYFGSVILQHSDDVLQRLKAAMDKVAKELAKPYSKGPSL